MNDSARRALCRLIHKHGRSIIEDPNRCKGLLHDYLPNDKPALTVLVSALRERVPADLIGSEISIDPLIARLVARLQQNQLLTQEAARWAVESWALALGVASTRALRAQPMPEPVQATPILSGDEAIDAGPVTDTIHGVSARPQAPNEIPDPPIWAWLLGLVVAGAMVIGFIGEVWTKKSTRNDPPARPEQNRVEPAPWPKDHLPPLVINPS